MTAYCIGTIRVKDRSAWDDYRSRVGATIEQYGGRVVFRGRPAEVFSGAAGHDAVVTLAFDSLDDARRWHDSAEYQALVPLRNRGAEVTLILYEVV